MKKTFKQLITGLALMISAISFSQVGIETETPQATLDVVGKPTESSVLDGIIAPRMEGAQLRAKTYTAAQRGALVYVTLADTAPAGQTIEVTAEGYYYFNGIKWIPSDGYNIYNSDGELTDNRTLDINNKRLTFEGTNESTSWSADGSINQSNSLTSGGVASMSFYGGNNSNLFIQQFRDSNAQIIATGNSTDLLLGTSYTTLPSSIRFDTSPGDGLIGEPRMFINPIGNVKIGENDSATEKLDVDGIARIRELPLNGAVNAHHTIDGDNASSTQNQTFTATKTVVADENGVLGYVTGLPTNLNIYNASGSLTSNRTLTLSNRTLDIIGSAQRTQWTSAGALWQFGTSRSSIYLVADTSSRLNFQIDPNSNGLVSATGSATGLSLITNATAVSAPITFITSAGSNAPGFEKMRITGTGNVGINTSSPSSVARLHIVKAASDLTPAIIQGCDVYADNAAATTAGVPIGGLYRKADGTLMVRF